MDISKIAVLFPLVLSFRPDDIQRENEDVRYWHFGNVTLTMGDYPSGGRLTVSFDQDRFYTLVWHHSSIKGLEWLTGSKTLEFVSKASEEYIFHKLFGRIRDELYEIDEDALHKKAVESIFMQRRQNDLSHEEARTYYDELAYYATIGYAEHLTEEGLRDALEAALGEEWTDAIPRSPTNHYRELQHLVTQIKTVCDLYFDRVAAEPQKPVLSVPEEWENAKS